MAQLVPARTQLPVSAYFDEAARFKREQELIFKQSALYVGHRKMVPEVGDWRTLVQEKGGRPCPYAPRGRTHLKCLPPPPGLDAGRRGGQCRGQRQYGRQSPGDGGNIVCPLHRWTYSAQGELLSARPSSTARPARSWTAFRLRDCHDLLFEGPRDPLQDIGGLFARPEFDFGDYVLDRVQIHQCNYNWKTFIEVYLEDYHVGPFHPGLGRFVSCADLAWDFVLAQRAAGGRTRPWPTRARTSTAPGMTGCWTSARGNAGLRRHLGNLLPHAHDRGLPARAGAVHAASARSARHLERGGVLLPGGNRRLRTRIRRSAASRLYGNRGRGRRNRRNAWTPAARRCTNAA